jgi:Nif-specific regulatory protein
VADTDLAVLILGENGTGKEVVAQLIHYLGERRDKPLLRSIARHSRHLAERTFPGPAAFTDAHEMRQASLNWRRRHAFLTKSATSAQRPG